ncbi:MAG: hypothetical protein JJU13_10530 [Balneolaceae bacterium]|nr:hypothetical protein [Balneolaceae bacterium]
MNCSADIEPDSERQTEPEQVFQFTISIKNAQAKPISPSGVYLYDPEQGRSGSPLVTFSGDDTGIITGQAKKGTPSLFRVHSAYHQIVYFFLPSYYEDTLSVTIHSEPVVLADEVTPRILGNFNHYDDFSAIEMVMDEDGTWSALIEADTDSLTYIIDGASRLGRVHGTDGQLRHSQVHTAIDPGIESVIRNDGSNRFEIIFDPARFSNREQSPEIRFGKNTPVLAAGIAKSYASMIRQADTIQVLEKQGETVTISHFDTFLEELRQVTKHYDHPTVEQATRLAKANFSEYLNPDDEWIDKLMEDIVPNSEIWLMHYPVLSDLFYHSTRMEDVSRSLWDIYRQHGHESVRGEALYNLLKFHYERGEDEEWYQAHYDLVRLYPDHKRINYSYNRGFAPQAVVHVGEYFPALEFSPLYEDEPKLIPAQNNAPLTILYFWSVNNTISREKVDLLENLYEEFAELGLTIYTIALDGNRERVQRFHEHRNLPWQGGFEQFSSSAIQVLGITEVPHTIILNNENRILVFDEEFLADEDVIESIDRYLNENL